ncbi:uncharacterized protein [Amphiura filiformis]|uniref:uncharacterized protein n=1 Tax=Amphiura filiformis TaxID=82378 RepID=UPI003B228480
MMSTDRGTTVTDDEEGQTQSQHLQAEAQVGTSRFRLQMDHKTILEELWNKGLTNTSSDKAKKLMEEARQRTNNELTKKQIQNWIGGKNRSHREDEDRATRPKPFNLTNALKKKAGKEPTEMQKMHAEKKKKYMNGKEQKSEEDKRQLFSEMHEAWAEAKEDLDTMATLRASVQNREEELPTPIDPSRRRTIAIHVTRQISKLCSFLKEELDYESYFIAAHEKDGNSYAGSMLGLEYLKEDDKGKIREFQYKVGGREGVSGKGLRAELITSVQDIFNEHYDKHTGKKHVQYSAIQEGRVHVEVEGFPPDVEFKKPCFYNNKTLADIVAVKGRLKFHVTRNDEEVPRTRSSSSYEFEDLTGSTTTEDDPHSSTLSSSETQRSRDEVEDLTGEENQDPDDMEFQVESLDPTTILERINYSLASGSALPAAAMPILRIDKVSMASGKSLQSYEEDQNRKAKKVKTEGKGRTLKGRKNGSKSSLNK